MRRLLLVLTLVLVSTASATAQDVLPIAVPAPLLTTPPPVAPRPTLNTELTIFAALQLGDVVSTRYALNQGGFEANPAQRWVTERNWRMVAVKGAITFVVVKVVKAALRKGNVGDARVVMAILNLGMAAVVANNVRVGRQMARTR